MFRLTSFVKAFAIAFAVAFSLAFSAGALLRSPAKPWSEVMGISALVAVTLELFIAWKLDEFRSAQLQHDDFFLLFSEPFAGVIPLQYSERRTWFPRQMNSALCCAPSLGIARRTAG